MVEGEFKTFPAGGWLDGWVGVEIQIHAMKAFNKVVVKVEAELGKIIKLGKA